MNLLDFLENIAQKHENVGSNENNEIENPEFVLFAHEDDDHDVICHQNNNGR